MDINKTIRDLIDATIQNPNAYSQDDIKGSVANYTECSDFELSNDDINLGLERIYKYLDVNELSDNKSCIITNSVNGKIARNIIENIHVYCFDNDYYCSMASRIVNKEKNKSDKIEFLFGDISQFFTSDFNSTFNADFIITCPSKHNEAYKDLDSEMTYRQMNSYEYYTKRSIEFLQIGGICLSIVPSSMERYVVSKLLASEKPVSILDTIKFNKGYSFIYIKKI